MEIHGFESRRRCVTQQTLPCFSCGKELEPAFKETFDGIYNQPHGGTVFRSSGHYGSTVWDPVTDSKHIELTICDTCLVAYKARVLLVKERSRAPEYDVCPWDPDVEM